MTYISFVYIIILLAVLFTGLQFAPRGIFTETFFSQTDSKSVQGFFVLCITLHHFSLSIRESACYDGSLDFIMDAGILFVGFFFFCSGYGLLISLTEKKDYLKTFLSKRLLLVLVPFFICNYIYMLTTQIMGIHFSSGELISAFFGLLLLNDQMWFAVEILILYLMFYLCFRFIKSERCSFLIMGFFTLGLIIMSLLLGHNGYTQNVAGKWFHGEWWYNTTILFYIGMLFGRFREKIFSFFRAHYRILLVSSLLAFFPLYYFEKYVLLHAGYWTETDFSMGYADKFLTLIAQFPYIFCFILFVLLILQKVHFSNRLLTFLGRISLEIILINKVFLLIFAPLGSIFRYHLYYALVLLCTVFSAFLIYRIKLFILNKQH